MLLPNLTIETARLYLRPFTLADVDELHRLWAEPGVRKYLWDDEVIPRGRVESIVEASIALFNSSGFGLWAVSPKLEDKLIGFCGFWHFHEPPKLELLYGISQKYWSLGIASEAATSIMRYGFEELSFDRIEASTDAANQASSQVMKRIGMSFWKQELTNGLDTVYYAITQADFDRGSPLL